MAEGNKFTWDAKDYARHSSTQQTWARELISKLKLNGCESVLDVGCGDGKITAEIAGYVPDGTVVGVDSSKEMIELARVDFAKNKYPNLSFQVIDARQLAFSGTDSMLFFQTLRSTGSRTTGLSSRVFKRASNRGAAYCCKWAEKETPNQSFLFLDEMMSENEWSQYFSDFVFSYGFYDPEEYTVWISEAGLESGTDRAHSQDHVI